MLGVGISLFSSFLLFFRGILFFFITSFWLSLHQEVSAFNNLCMRDEQRCINSRDVDLIAQVDKHTILIAWLTPRLSSSFRVQAKTRGAFCTYFFSITFLLVLCLFLLSCPTSLVQIRCLNLDDLFNIIPSADGLDSFGLVC